MTLQILSVMHHIMFAVGLILKPLKSSSTFTKTAKWRQGLGIQTNSRCSLGKMKMLSHLTVCLQRAMSAQTQEQTLITRALHECNGVTLWARAGPGRRETRPAGSPGLDGSLLRNLTPLVAVAARSLSS